jgi:peptidyl-tRNA hydrolase, PTH1 family
MSSSDPQIKKPTFIVGLGNPGSEYAKTRHNVGWLVVDEMVNRLAFQGVDLKVVKKSNFFGDVIIAKEKKLYFVKPTTFMNDSGKAVQAVMKFYEKTSKKEEIENLVVIHDDLDLVIGEFKLQFGRGPKVHNGLLSLYQHLGVKQFWHLRIGVDGRNGTRDMPGSSYVLQRFSDEELETLEDVVDEAIALTKML